MTAEDFGIFLAQQRDLRGFSRKDVARATKISESLIAAMEKGQLEKLPRTRVLVLNYVRAYARVIGLEPEEAVLRYQEVVNAPAAGPTPQALEVIRRRKAYWQLGLLLLLLGGAAILGLGWAGLLPR